MSSSELEIQSLTIGYAGQLLALSRSLEWDFTLKYWQVLLSTGEVIGCLSGDGKLIGTASFIRYSDTHCFIGAVIVAQSMQGQGVGKLLMSELNRRIGKFNLPAKLISTEEGFPLYQKLGFETVDYCTKMVCAANIEKPALPDLAGVTIKPLSGACMPKLLEFDAACFQADRTHVLSALVQAGYAGIMAVDRQTDQTLGFAIMIDRGEHLCIGPVVAKTEALALALVQVMIYGQTRSVRVDSLSDKVSFRRELKRLGFDEEATSPLMMRGGGPPHRSAETVFGIVTQAIG